MEKADNPMTETTAKTTCSECGTEIEADGIQANVELEQEIERLSFIIERYETSITTHRKLMLTQIEQLAKLRD